MSFLITLLSITKLLVHFLYYLAILTIVLILLYKFIFVAYPRLFITGHSEDQFESWLGDFTANFFNYILDLKDKGILTSQITAFLSQYNNNFSINIDKSKLINVNFENVNFTPIMMMFIFFHDLKNGNDDHIKNCFNIFQDSSPLVIKLLKTFYNPKNKTPSEFIAYPKFKALFESFATLRLAIEKAAKSKLSFVDNIKNNDKVSNNDIQILVLDLMLNIYLSPGNNYGDKLTFSEKCANIERMSRFRMTGKGNGENWTMVKLYTEEYQYYIIYERIVPLWKKYPEDAAAWKDLVFNTITDPAISQWISNLPYAFAGGFTDNQVVEHFGLDKIIMAFISIGKVFMSLVSMITQPMSFIKFLIGAIFSLFLQIIYIFVVLIGGNIIAPVFGYVGRVFYNVALTVFIFAVLLLYYIIYTILALIDTVAGGIIMKALRCENLPDAWAKIPEFSKSNKYVRTFFCSIPCAKRYSPEGFFCSKKAKEIPTFAPQQVIYQTWENNMYIKSLNDKIIYDKSPEKSYFLNLTPEEQKEFWASVYEDSTNYYAKTMSEYSKFDPIIRGMCTCMTDSNVKNNLSVEDKKKVKQICQYTYCTSKDGRLSNLPFCNDFKNTLMKPEEGPIEKKNIIKLILYVLVAITFTFTSVILLMYYKNAFFLELVSDLGIELYKTQPKL